ncbi:MAG TPA: hypothetical protein VGW98_05110 [Solirubrobacteraceae bacterium]|nr:hypothetical protein [Solirubrobacteraceae bacterium]
MTAPPLAQLRPLLLVDIDGVISLFGQPAAGSPERLAAGGTPLDASFHAIEGIPHFLSSTAAAHLLSLAELFELVWASGWEERANEHLPHLLGLPKRLPFLRFPRGVLAAGAGNIPGGFLAGAEEPGGPSGAGGPQATLAHWKLQSIDAYAGERQLAWIDDAFNGACHEWAAARATPTLLVQTEPELGLTSREAAQLEEWALELKAQAAGR